MNPNKINIITGNFVFTQTFSVTYAQIIVMVKNVLILKKINLAYGD